MYTGGQDRKRQLTILEFPLIDSRQNKEQDIPLNLKFYSHVGATLHK